MFTTKDSEISKIKTISKTCFHVQTVFKGKGFKNIKESVKMLVISDLGGIMKMPNDFARRDFIHLDDLINHHQLSLEREKLEEDLKGLTDCGLTHAPMDSFEPTICLSAH